MAWETYAQRRAELDGLASEAWAAEHCVATAAKRAAASIPDEMLRDVVETLMEQVVERARGREIRSSLTQRPLPDCDPRPVRESIDRKQDASRSMYVDLMMSVVEVPRGNGVTAAVMVAGLQASDCSLLAQYHAVRSRAHNDAVRRFRNLEQLANRYGVVGNAPESEVMTAWSSTKT